MGNPLVRFWEGQEFNRVWTRYCGTVAKAGGKRRKRVYPGFPTLFWGLSGFFVNDLMGKALWSSWKTRSVFQGAVGAFCASTAPSASTGPICMRQDRRVLGLQSTRE